MLRYRAERNRYGEEVDDLRISGAGAGPVRARRARRVIQSIA